MRTGAVTEETDVLADHSLVIVGRFLYSDNDSYYIPTQRWEFMRDLAAPFQDMTYIGFVLDRPEDTDCTEVDPVVLDVAPNHAWQSDVSVPRRLVSLRRDLRAVDGDRLVTYTYYPGTYSFLLAPAVLRRGDVNVAYFGKASAVTTGGLTNGRLMNRVQQAVYPRAERYVVDRSDVVFTRDPRVGGHRTRTDVHLSKPVTDAIPDVVSSPSAAPISNPVDLLYVASFRPSKGHKHLVDALNRLQSDADREFRLHFVGDGQTRSRIEHRVAQQGLSDLVVFHGHVADDAQLETYYKESDLFVLPSETEGFPRVLNEAMAYGLPVVATRVGGIPALLTDREHAVLVEPQNPAALANGIETLLSDRSLRNRLVERGAEFARKQAGDPVDQHIKAIRRRVT